MGPTAPCRGLRARVADVTVCADRGKRMPAPRDLPGLSSRSAAGGRRPAGGGVQESSRAHQNMRHTRSAIVLDWMRRGVPPRFQWCSPLDGQAPTASTAVRARPILVQTARIECSPSLHMSRTADCRIQAHSSFLSCEQPPVPVRRVSGVAYPGFHALGRAGSPLAPAVRLSGSFRHGMSIC